MQIRSVVITRTWVPVLLAAALAGCAVDKAGCDPRAMRDAGFFTKLSCDMSGSYGARAEDQKSQLAQAQASNKLLQDIVADLEAENRALQQGITVQRAQRDRLVRSINSYLSQIEQQAGQNSTLKQQVTKAKAQLDQFKAMPPGTPSREQQMKLNQVQKEIETLRGMVR